MITSTPISRSPLSLSQSTLNFNSSLPPPLLHLKRSSLTTASSACTSSILPPSSSSASSFYDILGIQMEASSDEIKSAFRKLARVCHPDVAVQDAPTQEFSRIHTAYSTLSDPTKRANYDREILQRYRSFTVLSSSASVVRSPSRVYTHRNWETDQCW